jgi:hypothetical protein
MWRLCCSRGTRRPARRSPHLVGRAEVLRELGQLVAERPSPTMSRRTSPTSWCSTSRARPRSRVSIPFCRCSRPTNVMVAGSDRAHSRDRPPRTVVARVLHLEERQDVLGAVGGPQRRVRCSARRGPCLQSARPGVWKPDAVRLERHPECNQQGRGGSGASPPPGRGDSDEIRIGLSRFGGQDALSKGGGVCHGIGPSEGVGELGGALPGPRGASAWEVVTDQEGGERVPRAGRGRCAARGVRKPR